MSTLRQDDFAHTAVKTEMSHYQFSVGINKTIFFILFFTFFLVNTVHSQLYYKIENVLNLNFEYLDENAQEYKDFAGRVVSFTVTPYQPNAYVKIGSLPQLGPYPYAGMDGNGYNVYAYKDFYGNVMYQDFMGNLSYVAVSSDFEILSFPLSFNGIIVECVQTTKQEYDKELMAEIELQTKINMAIQNAGGYTGGGISTEPIQSGMSEDWYHMQYSKWESNAQSIYNSLTSTGVRVTTEDNEKRGYSDWNNSSEIGMKTQLSKAQSEMRSIRNEAARNGYTIMQSTWETATVR